MGGSWKIPNKMDDDLGYPHIQPVMSILRLPCRGHGTLQLRVKMPTTQSMEELSPILWITMR